MQISCQFPDKEKILVGVESNLAQTIFGKVRKEKERERERERVCLCVRDKFKVDRKVFKYFTNLFHFEQALIDTLCKLSSRF